MCNALKFCKIFKNSFVQVRFGCCYFFNLLKFSTVHKKSKTMVTIRSLRLSQENVSFILCLILLYLFLFLCLAGQHLYGGATWSATLSRCWGVCSTLSTSLSGSACPCSRTSTKTRSAPSPSWSLCSAACCLGLLYY